MLVNETAPICTFVVPLFSSVKTLFFLSFRVTFPKLMMAGEKLTSLTPEVLNVAVSEAAALIVTEQAPVPVQGPLQPAKVDPLSGVSVNVTIVPLAKFAVQVVPQLIPVGLLVTVPVPVPASVTVRA